MFGSLMNMFSSAMGAMGSGAMGAMQDAPIGNADWYQTGTPDNTGPIQGGYDAGILGDLTDDQLQGLINKQQDPMVQRGMTAGLGAQAQPQQAMPLQSLMGMASQGGGQLPYKDFMQHNTHPYMKSLMGN